MWGGVHWFPAIVLVVVAFAVCCSGCGGWGRLRHESRQRVSVGAEGYAGWQASFCDLQGYEHTQYRYTRALARPATDCSRQS
jgi:hypothetical protein